MRVTHISILMLSLLMGASAAWAEEDRAAPIIRQLRADGFTQIQAVRTWLGRLRFLAQGPQGTREIVIDPRNGAVLRDYFDPSARDGFGASVTQASHGLNDPAAPPVSPPGEGPQANPQGSGAEPQSPNNKRGSNASITAESAGASKGNSAAAHANASSASAAHTSFGNAKNDK